MEYFWTLQYIPRRGALLPILASIYTNLKPQYVSHSRSLSLSQKKKAYDKGRDK